MILFYTLFYMSSDNFLDNSEFKKPKFTIQYTMGGAPKKLDIDIYDDDTVKEVLIKLAVGSKKNVTSDHIFAWVDISGKLIPLGF